MGCYRGMTGGEVYKLWTLMNACMDRLGDREGWEGDRKGILRKSKNKILEEC
jgi:hypothetical protein